PRHPRRHGAAGRRGRCPVAGPQEPGGPGGHLTAPAARGTAREGAAAVTGTGTARSTAVAVPRRPAPPRAAAADRPGVTLSRAGAGPGGTVTVRGAGWRPRALLPLRICGRFLPSSGVPDGTDSCADADGRAVTTDGSGRFRRTLPVVEPPVPCPCVVHAETATGARTRKIGRAHV